MLIYFGKLKINFFSELVLEKLENFSWLEWLVIDYELVHTDFLEVSELTEEIENIVSVSFEFT